MRQHNPTTTPNIVVILPSNTYRATDFVEAADALGVDLVVASEQPPPFDMGNRYVQIDCADPEAAAGTLARLGDTVPIDGVVAADDQGVMVAAHTSSLLGLPGNAPGAAATTRNKLLMRDTLAASEVAQPRFTPLAPGDDPERAGSELGLPLVMKPIDRASSQGVIRVDRPEDLRATAKRIRRIVGEDATLLAESYVPGVEIAVEGLITTGDLEVLAIFDKPDTPSGPYFPETLFITPSRLDESTLDEAIRTAGAAVRALGLTSGPAHIELRVEDGQARVIEVAARSIGGLCSRSLHFGLMGTTLESLILRNAIGVGGKTLRREPTASGVLMLPTPRTGLLVGISGEEEARSIPGVTGMDFTIRPGGSVVAPPEGDRYLGFVYARSKTPADVESALRKVMTTLQVQVEG